MRRKLQKAGDEVDQSLQCERSTTKGSEDAAYVAAKLEYVMVEVSGVKMDVKSARADPKIEFQVESVEKDVSAGVEERIQKRVQENLSPKETTTVKILKLMRAQLMFQFLKLSLQLQKELNWSCWRKKSLANQIFLEIWPNEDCLIYLQQQQQQNNSKPTQEKNPQVINFLGTENEAKPKSDI